MICMEMLQEIKKDEFCNVQKQNLALQYPFGHGDAKILK
ncbi:hypothetical protein J699_00766 [Acinetobacter sp. 1000160]|nr:hypothetical protein J522_3952 [Acinetobacter baumannii 146457]EYT22735.1 hypothetical protein J699_00766 [Acinetobacter sp. 1000160]